jgi:hypothetical protein
MWGLGDEMRFRVLGPLEILDAGEWHAVRSPKWRVLTAPLPVGEWSHLAVTISGSTGTLYVNGSVAGTNTAMTLNPAALGALANHWLGRSLYPDAVFAGAFGGFDIWSRALPAAEIGALQAKAGDGDLASYAFDTLIDRPGRSGPAVVRRTCGGPSHPGFLAAYPETQFSTLESMTSGDYTVVWAPHYTAHKILRGLFEAYRATGDERALDLASGMCDWMYARLSKLPKATLQRMWGIFSSGEFGGIVEAICDVHAVTGRAEHIALAKLFDLDHLIDSCAAGTDVLTSAGRASASLEGARPHRRHTRRHERRDVLRVQHAEAEPDAVLPRAGPALPRLLRARAVQPGPRVQTGPAGRREAAGHLLHRAEPGSRPGLHAEGRDDVLRRHRDGERDQVPGHGLLPQCGRQHALREPVQPVEAVVEGRHDRAADELPVRAGVDARSARLRAVHAPPAGAVLVP